MKRTLDELALIERRDAWIRRLSHVFFAALFALLLTAAVVGALAFILDSREQTQRDSRAAASRRIDQLQGLVQTQAGQIAKLSTDVGRLTAGMDALTTQLRQNHLVPVVTPAPVVSSPTPRPTPQASPTPRPRSSPTRKPTPRPSPRPSPSPSPTCHVSNPITGRCVLPR